MFISHHCYKESGIQMFQALFWDPQFKNFGIWGLAGLEVGFLFHLWFHKSNSVCLGIEEFGVEHRPLCSCLSLATPEWFLVRPREGLRCCTAMIGCTWSIDIIVGRSGHLWSAKVISHIFLKSLLKIVTLLTSALTLLLLSPHPWEYISKAQRTI